MTATATTVQTAVTVTNVVKVFGAADTSVRALDGVSVDFGPGQFTAIILGVGFVSGTLIFSDTAKAATYDSLARFGRNVDVSVRAPETTTTRSVLTEST